MYKKDYDKTLSRLLGILTKLSNGEMPTVKELAVEYNVGVRTIQRDINERLIYYPIVRTKEHQYRFEYGYSLKKTTLSNKEMMFLNLALSQFNDVDDIETLKDNIYKKIINKKFYNPYFIKQDDMEDLNLKSAFISQIEQIISSKEIAEVTFTHEVVQLEFYKIAAFDGFWYLFAKDRDLEKVKVYKLSQIKKITPTNTYHKTQESYIENILGHVHSAFFEDGNSFRVVIEVYKEIAPYFKRRDFIESQRIEKENADGSLIVSFEVTHDEDIDNIIKSWLPHVVVLEPQRYREKFLKELEEYIGNYSSLIS